MTFMTIDIGARVFYISSAISYEGWHYDFAATVRGEEVIIRRAHR